MPRWTTLAEDPNSLAAIRSCAEVLAACRASPVENRIDYLRDLARGRRVVDVGVVDHSLDSERVRTEWLHGEVRAAASYCLGVDVLPEAVERLQAQGLNVKLADITREPLGESDFELMICGELIEHLGSPAALFEAAGRLLIPGGLLAITTPNPYYLPRTYHHLRGRSLESVDHVTLLSPSNLAELAERAGFEMVRYRGVAPARPHTFLGAAAFWFARRALPPEASCNSIIYEFRRQADAASPGPQRS